MKTLNITSTSRSLRTGLTLAGIVIAIICSLVLLKGVYSAGREEAKLPNVDQASAISSTVKAGNVTVVAVIDLFK